MEHGNSKEKQKWGVGESGWTRNNKLESKRTEYGIKRQETGEEIIAN